MKTTIFTIICITCNDVIGMCADIVSSCTSLAKAKRTLDKSIRNHYEELECDWDEAFYAMTFDEWIESHYSGGCECWIREEGDDFYQEWRIIENSLD